MLINIDYTDPNKTVEFASIELKKYLLQLNNNVVDGINIELKVEESLTKYDMPIVEQNEFDDQYYINTTNKKSGVIIGNNPRSVLMGIYKYLYLIGFRFLRPGDEFTHIPKIVESDLLVEYKGIAKLRHRGICIEGANSFENVVDMIDWLPKIGFNSFFVQFKIPYTFLEMWYNHKYNPCLKPEGFDIIKAKELSKLIDKEIEKRSILHHRVGHGWTAQVIGHSELGWMKSDKDIEDKKEYLALIEGKRQLYGNIPINTNLCYSNKDVIEKMSNNIVEYAMENPNIQYLHVWLADENNNMCECSECLKTTPTDQYVNILNIIDDKMTSKKIKTKIVFLLYHELLWAPVKEAYVNSDRFILMFAPISRTFEKSYSELGDEVNIPRYKRNQIKPPVSIEENIAFLKEWRKIFGGDGFVYDYPLGRAHYGDMGYIHISKIILRDIKYIKNLELNGYISCQELRSFLPNGLPNYVMGMSLFNDDIEFKDISKDYFKHAYGENWKLVYDYLNKISSLSSCDYFNGIGSRKDMERAKAYSEIEKTAEDFLNSNLKQKDLTTVQKKFWDILVYHASYCIYLSKALGKLASGNKNEAQKKWLEFAGYIQNNELKYQSTLDVYRVIEVATKYTGFDLTFN